MIKEIEYFEKISGEFSPLFSRIFAALKYKSGSDNAWQQVDENGNMTALLSAVDGNFTLVATENTDFCEIKEFISFMGCNSIVSNVPLSSSAKSYALFKFCGNENTGIAQEFVSLSKDSTMNEYKNFYSLLFADSVNDFDSWYCDFSKKIVNNDAKAICLKQMETLVSIATVPMIYKNTAIISGIYTLESYRNRGYSKATIYKLVEVLKKENITDIYLWCEKHLEEFYNKLGFEIIGKVYIEMEL
jgi:predicted GNAT family N-acyltransferase